MKLRPLVGSALLITLVAALLFIIHCLPRRSMVVAVIPQTTATDFWESMHAGVDAAAAKGNFKILWNAPQSEADYAQQAELVEKYIHEKVQAIVLAPSHASVLASAVRHAKAEHIPVVIVDSPIDTTPDDYVAYIASNNRLIGQMAADRMAKILNGQGEIAILGVSPTVEGASLREVSFENETMSKYPHIRIVEIQYGLSDPGRSRLITLDLVRNHPKLKGIFASDEFSTLGAASLLKGSVRYSDVKLIGMAQERDMLDQVQTGTIDSLIVQDPYQMGFLAIEAIGSPANGLAPKQVEIPTVLVTRENINTTEVRSLTSHYLK